MKKFLRVVLVLVVVAVVGVAVTAALLPWMDAWGASQDEIAASVPGDELVPSPRYVYNRAVSVNAAPGQIYPWLVQMGAERGGMYTYSWFETNILRCELINADRIHEEWQDLKMGDKVKMCPGTGGPPAYEVAMMETDRAVVLGHQADGAWTDVWQFILIPQSDGTTRLIARGRNSMPATIWDIIRPGEFIMMRGMLLGIKERAERLAEENPLEITQPASPRQTVGWSEFGRDISLSYDSIPVPQVEATTVAAVPVSDQILFAESHPAYVQIRFPGFQDGRSYELPLLPLENQFAQVMVFQTADFSGFGNGNPLGFPGQLQALTELLKTGIDPHACTQPFKGHDEALPFLPWINAQQSFCAHPRIIEFSGGRGIRTLSHYAQGAGPVLDGQVFYTFQGLTDDGKFYVSAIFPVETGIFPTEPQPCPECGDPNHDPFADWMTLLIEQVTLLNAQPKDRFSPSLMALDELIQTIRIEPQD